MPKEGPGGRWMYEPREAYDTVGRHLYPAAWELFFHTGPPLPHRPDDNQEYRFRQIRARRSSKAFSDLTDALYWGKSAVWTYGDEKEWTAIPHEEWEPGSQLIRVLHDDLERVITRNEPATRSMFIEKAPLDEYLNGWVASHVDGHPGAIAPHPPNRPGIDLEPLRTELRRLENSGELPEIKKGWRIEAVRHLLRMDFNWYPTAKTEKEPPTVKTLLKRLKRDLDNIEGRQSRR